MLYEIMTTNVLLYYYDYYYIYYSLRQISV
jgi:hypothetical protein